MYNFNPSIPLATFYATGSNTFSAGYDTQAIMRAILQNDWATVAKIVREYNKLAFFMATCDKPIATVAKGQICTKKIYKINST